MGRSTPDSIRESHMILERVMDGQVDPHSQRAKRAYRVAMQNPLSELDRELDAAYAPQTLQPPPVVRHHSPPAPTMNDVVMDMMFGSLAPQVKNIAGFMQTPKGRKITAVGGIALATLLAPRVIR